VSDKGDHRVSIWSWYHCVPFGLAALEPAACGIPVIASNKGGLPEVVDHQRTGFVFPAGDWHELARLIEHAIDHPDEFAVLGANGQRRARELFSEEAMLARLREL
jgi:glycosyltransferase involved in cell wall biosynthesis